MENLTLFVGGTHDGRRIRIPDGQHATELFEAGGKNVIRERYYFTPLGRWAVYAHESLSPDDVLEILIRRYPQPLIR